MRSLAAVTFLLAAVVLFCSLLSSPAYAVDDGRWTKLTILSDNGQVPDARRHAVMVYDPPNKRAIIFGGDRHGSPDVVYNDVWALELGCGQPQWRRLYTDDGSVPCIGGTRPCRRHGHAAAYVPGTGGNPGRLVTHGGKDASGTILDDTWELTLGASSTTWTKRSTHISGAVNRYHSAAIFFNNQFMIMGGQDASGSAYNDRWSMNMSDTTWGHVGGSLVCCNNQGSNEPIRRYFHTYTLDTEKNRMIVLGGQYDGEEITQFAWSANGTTDSWTTSFPGISTLYFHHAAYDWRRARMIVTGGRSGGSLVDDVWAVPLPYSGTYPGTFTALSPTGTGPGSHAEGAAAWDSDEDRLLLFGGIRLNGSTEEYTNDVWVLEFDTKRPGPITTLDATGSTSSSLTLSFTAPGDDSLTGAACSYDLRYSTSPIEDDADFASATTVSGEPTPASPGTSQQVTVSGLTAGVWYYFRMKTTDEMPFTSALSNEVCAKILNPGYIECFPEATIELDPESQMAPRTAVLEFRRVAPNPSPGNLNVTFALPRAGDARIELIDLAGRRLEQIDLGGLGAGEHSIQLGNQRQLPIGRFIVRLVQGEAAVTREITVTR